MHIKHNNSSWTKGMHTKKGMSKLPKTMWVNFFSSFITLKLINQITFGKAKQ